MAEASREELFEQVKEIIVEQLGVDPDQVTEGARFREDLEADSLDLVEFIMEVEDVFGGEISDEEAQQIQTVGQAVDYLEARMKAGE
jgi:acyl carrier protein